MLLENIKLIKKLTKLMFDPKALQKSAILGVLALTSLSILGSECVSNWEFLHSLGKELMVMIILP